MVNLFYTQSAYKETGSIHKKVENKNTQSNYKEVKVPAHFHDVTDDKIW